MTETPKTSGVAGWGALILCAMAVYFLFVVTSNDPQVPSEVDATGYISHTVQSAITARSNWLVGETKYCVSNPLDPGAASLAERKTGYAFLRVQCDDGPEHNIEIKFLGAEYQPGTAEAQWKCTRSEESFTCLQTGAIASY
jgi:hypothetical protein